MNLAYFKRLRMDINLSGRGLMPTPVPEHYHFLLWEESLLDAFARAKYLSFRGEIDTEVFPCLAEFDGCRRLMREIVRKPGFVPESTWLVVHAPGNGARPEYCGTVQGVRDCHGCGAIQNIGVAPEHRRSGLGTGLLLRSLAGFLAAGVHRVYLEVTMQNEAAIRLYRRVGFTPLRTVYKTVEAAYSP
jgi:ribosomal protein S18 acetylase RimI-like enzyme